MSNNPNGRPYKYGEPTCMVHIKVPESIKALVAWQAEALGKSQAEIIVAALQKEFDWITHHETNTERWKNAANRVKRN